VAGILSLIFPRKHVEAMLKHFQTGTKEYCDGNWEGVGLKAGKFVEAASKCLMIYCGQPLPTERKFHAGPELRKLESLATFSDTVRLVIPKACLFIYEIASNRGARHDSDIIDANAIDAEAVMPLMGWVIAEMLKFSSPNAADAAEVAALIGALTQKRYPFFEEIDGRPYVNLGNTSASDIALLLMYFRSPRRIERQLLVDAIIRHGHKKKAAETAAYRIRNLVDDKDGAWQLRGLGREKAEHLLEERYAHGR